MSTCLRLKNLHIDFLEVHDNEVKRFKQQKCKILGSRCMQDMKKGLGKCNVLHLLHDASINSLDEQDVSWLGKGLVVMSHTKY